MNRIYRVVWSVARNAYVVVSEFAHGRKGYRSFLAAVAASAFLLTGSSSITYAADGQVLAGENNIASGDSSTILGGHDNKATEKYSTISGGNKNTASNDSASVSGGESNTASGNSASVSGGNTNEARGGSSSVSGGHDNLAQAEYTSVSGGSENTATGNTASVSGGIRNVAQGVCSSVSGGEENTAVESASSVSGGKGNKARGPWSSVSGGTNNTALGYYSSAVGGDSSVAQGGHSTVIGGSTGDKAENAVAIGRSSVVTVENGVAIGHESTTSEAGTIAFGHDAGDIAGYDLQWERRTDTDEQGNIIKNADGTTNDYTKMPTVTERKYGSASYNRLVKVHDGQSAHDAATVGQTLELVAGDYVNIENDATPVNAIGQQRKKVSIKVDGAVAEGNTGLVTGGTIYDAILVKSDGKEIAIAKHDSASVINVAGNHARVITGVSTDVNDPSSAVNVASLKANNQQIYQDMNAFRNGLTEDINRATAGSNALAALKPLDFDEDDKLQFGVGYGHYHNANATAAGVFYQPDENCLLNLGATIGNGSPGISAGITFKIGRGSSKLPSMSKKQMASLIHEQSLKLEAQSTEIASLRQENQAIQQQLQMILAKLK